MINNTLWLIGLLLFVYLFFGLFLYLRQQQFLYFPTQAIEIAEVESRVFKSDNHKLKVWVVNPQRPTAIIYFGGNAEQVGDVAIQYGGVFADETVYLTNYRGFGGSEGSPSEQGLKQDALNLYDQLAKQHSKVILMGRSLGSSIALHVAARRPAHHCILVTPFDSILRLGQQRFGLYPIQWLLRDVYESWRDAPNVNCPLHIIIADQDRTVPKSSSDRLIDSLKDKSTVVKTLVGSGHNGIEEHPDYFKYLQDARRTF